MNGKVVVSQLIKSYDKKHVLCGVDLTVDPGEVVGIIGPNGAGKTTLLAIIAGLLSWDSGKVTIDGRNPQDILGATDKIWVAFSSSQYGAFDYLTGSEILMTHGILSGLDRERTTDRTEELLQYFSLDTAPDLFVYEYSYGMRKKLSLACALIAEPSVLLLDEPFDGLDPTSVIRTVAAIQQSAGTGSAVLVSSHDISLVEQICTCAHILHGGALQAPIALQGLREGALAERAKGTSLEAAMWEIVGLPEKKTLSWL